MKMKKNRRILNNIIQLIKILNFVKKYQLLIFIDLRIFYINLNNKAINIYISYAAINQNKIIFIRIISITSLD